MDSALAKALVLGLGNDILTDDAIGIQVAREVRRRVAHLADVDVRETMEMGLALLDFIVGYETLFIIDAIQTGRATPGHIHEITQQQLKLLPDRTPHFLGIAETLQLGWRLGLAMPSRLKIFAVEVADPFTFGTEMTAALQQALPIAVERIVAEVNLCLQPSL
jgi:hydrogenase maturation protease